MMCTECHSIYSRLSHHWKTWQGPNIYPIVKNNAPTDIDKLALVGGYTIIEVKTAIGTELQTSQVVDYIANNPTLKHVANILHSNETCNLDTGNQTVFIVCKYCCVYQIKIKCKDNSDSCSECKIKEGHCWQKMKITKDAKVGFHPGFQAGMAAKSSKANESEMKAVLGKKSASCTSKGTKKITPDSKKQCGNMDNEQTNNKKSKTDTTTEFMNLQVKEFIDVLDELFMENVHSM